jgi:hypothetical protein
VAVNAIGDSPVSSPALSVIAAQVPVTPDAPSMKATSKTSTTIQWVAPNNGGSPITGYSVEWNGGGTGTTFSVQATITDPSLTEHIVSGLSAG